VTIQRQRQHKKQNEDKQSKNKTQKTKYISNTDPTKKTRSEHRSSRRISSSYFL